MTLKKVMGMSSVMEAEFLHFLVTIAIKCSLSCPYDASNDVSNLIVAARLLRELIKVERFGTVFHLIVHGRKFSEAVLTAHLTQSLCMFKVK